jgi:CubicO group peptidase (beta-lactamase class C family)
VRDLAGKPSLWPDLNVGVPMAFHLGYHGSPIPGLLHGFGHIGLGGTLGWADPETASSFGYVHNRLLTPMVLDMAAFAALARPMRVAIEAARHAGPMIVPDQGAAFPKPRRRKAVTSMR